MTGSTYTGIDALVLQWNMGRRERAQAMLQGNQALVDQIKAEIARLEAPGPRDLLKTDAVSQQLYRVLKVIQAASPNGTILDVNVANSDAAIDSAPVAQLGGGDPEVQVVGGGSASVGSGLEEGAGQPLVAEHVDAEQGEAHADTAALDK